MKIINIIFECKACGTISSRNSGSIVGFSKDIKFNGHRCKECQKHFNYTEVTDVITEEFVPKDDVTTK